MAQAKLSKFSVLVLVLVIVSLVFIGTIASNQSTIKGDVSAIVSSWVFSVNGQADKFDIDLNARNKLLKPDEKTLPIVNGEKGFFIIELKNDSPTSVDYSVALGGLKMLENVHKMQNFNFYYGGTVADDVAIETLINGLKEYNQPDETQMITKDSIIKGTLTKRGDQDYLRIRIDWVCISTENGEVVESGGKKETGEITIVGTQPEPTDKAYAAPVFEKTTTSAPSGEETPTNP